MRSACGTTMRLKWLPEQGAVLNLVLTEQPDKASAFAFSYISNKCHLPAVAGRLVSPTHLNYSTLWVGCVLT
jgi:hypothetical protein